VQLVSDTRPAVKQDRLLRLPEVESVTGLKKSTIYNLMKAGKFVNPVRISKRCTAWPAGAVYGWVQAQIASAGNGQ
jgi:prophage regulatory protein